MIYVILVSFLIIFLLAISLLAIAMVGYTAICAISIGINKHRIRKLKKIAVKLDGIEAQMS